MTDYLKKEDLLAILNRYRKNKKNADEFIGAISLIAKNLIRRYPFHSSGCEPNDYIQEAVLICLIKQHCFTSSKGNAFAYFTTIIMNQWKHLWNCDKKFYDVIEEYGRRQGSQNIMSTDDS